MDQFTSVYNCKSMSSISDDAEIACPEPGPRKTGRDEERDAAPKMFTNTNQDINSDVPFFKLINPNEAKQPHLHPFKKQIP